MSRAPEPMPDDADVVALLYAVFVGLAALILLGCVIEWAVLS